MKWYQLTPNKILPFANKAEAYRYALERHIALQHIKPTKLTALSTQSYLKFLEALQLHLNTGHSLQSALTKQNPYQYSNELRYHVLAMQSLLEEGQHIATVLTLFMPSNIKHLSNCIPFDGPEETKIAAIQLTQTILESQQKLTNTLLKSLSYPFLVIQSSILLACMNALLTKQSILMPMSTWVVVSLFQLALYLWIDKGHAYPTLCASIRSFRTYNLLMILVALLDSGETLQEAIRKLLQGSSSQDKLSLQKCFLLLNGGTPIHQALPESWFDKQLKTQLDHVAMTGDLKTPLSNSANYWQDRNQRILNRFSKAFPILGIVVSAVFVTQTLMALYAPIMDVNAFGL